MRRTAILFTVLATAFAVAGAALRTVELNTALELASSLSHFEPVTVVLLCLSALALLAFLLLSRKHNPSVPPPADDVLAFGAATLPPLCVSVLSLGLCLWGSYLCCLDWRSGGGAVMGILALFSGLSGAGYLYLSLRRLRRQGRDGMLSASMQVLFVCFWLVIFYKDNAPKPSLLCTIYDYLALCAALLAFYRLAGYSAGRASLKKTLFYSGAALYFIAVAAVGPIKPAYRLFYLAIAAQLYTSAVLLLCYKPAAAPGVEGEAPAVEAPAEEGSTEEGSTDEAPAEETPAEPDRDGDAPGTGEA